jgi:hypothetical protein
VLGGVGTGVLAALTAGPAGAGGRDDQGRAVRRWLEAPIRTRGLPDRGPDSTMSGGTLAQWFDVIVHRQEVTPVLPV